MPKNIVDRDDHDVMERLLGKRAMREIDAEISRLNRDEAEQKPSTNP